MARADRSRWYLSVRRRVRISMGARAIVAVALMLAIGMFAAPGDQAGADTLDFAPQATYPADDNPSSVATADLDGDGAPDLATANRDSDNVSVLLNNDDGTGTFAAQATYAVGDFPFSVVAADLNGDGAPDLATANTASHHVSVLLNNDDGTGTFAAHVTYGVGPHPVSIAAADLNGDGAPDLATANRDSDNVSVLLNTGVYDARGLAPRVAYDGGGGPRSVAVADLDGDGDQDLATANDPDGVSILRGNGTGAFITEGPYATGANPSSVITADLDTDGDLDLVTANSSSHNVSILRNDGMGSFATEGPYPTGNGPSSVVAVDVDTDGDLDLVTANAGSDNISILPNDGDGTFGAHDTVAVGRIPRAVAVFDFDTDGHLDLAVTSEESDAVLVLVNDGTGTFGYGPGPSSGTSPVSIAAADLDGDGDDDLAVANKLSNNVSVIFAGTTTIWKTGTRPVSISAADLDRDGDLDLVTANEGSDDVSVLLNDGDGTFQPALVSLTFGVGEGPSSVVAANLDGDGDVDIVTVDRDFDDAGTSNFDPSVSVLLAGPVALSIDDISLPEGDAGTKPANFAVSSPTAPYVDATLQANTADGTAVAPDDYTATGPATVTLEAGSFSTPFDVPVAGDAVPEPDEVFVVTLSDPVGTLIADRVGVATILDDDTVDRGDAPDSYGTTAASDGPRHFIDPALRLGAAVDVDTDGQPSGDAGSSGADGDDGDGNDDEDGVAFPTPLRPADHAAPVRLNASAPAKLDAWIDFDRDGTFAHPGEQIFASRVLVAGDNDLTFPVPPGASLGDTFARFRVSSAGGLGPKGPAPNGEVEDHRVAIELGALDALGLAPSAIYGTGTSPRSVAAADLNGDGAPEIVTANQASNNLTVRRNAGDGTFPDQTTLGVGSAPVSVVAADLDADGDQDLASADAGSNHVSVLRNAGDGTFSTLSTPGVGTGPVSVAAADLDRDGDVDLATANQSSHNVSVLLNDGDGTFATHVTHSTGAGSNPFSVIAADLDGDGELDLATANLASNSVSVLRNNGDGTFVPHATPGVGSLPFSIIAADLDADGDLDLATANDGSNGASVLRNNGDGTFAAHSTHGVGSGPHGVTAADLDRDGDLDLVTANADSDDLSFLRNDGTAVFASHVTYGTGNEPFSVIAADLDADGALDLATADFSGNSASVLLADPVTVSIDDVTHPEGDGGTSPATFTISSPVAPYTAASVEVATADGTATAPGDYTATGPATVTLPAGAFSAPFAVPVVDDDDDEPDETFTAGLSSPAGTLVGDATGTATILDDDAYDWGDAPDSYGTAGSNGARHPIGTGPRLGSTVDGDTDGQPSADAGAGGTDGDDGDGTDDEDGVSFGSSLIAGEVADITVAVSGSPGQLDAWIDFDGDGTFAHPGEKIPEHTVVPGNNRVSFQVPADAGPGTTFARFRITAGGLSFPTDLNAPGEVEDYAVDIVGVDAGDAPDSFSTLRAADGPRHALTSSLRLGASVDGDADGRPSTTSDGDDGAGSDDEDGVVFPSEIRAGDSEVPVTVNASALGLLDAWVDFDGDGTFAHPDEQIFASRALSPGDNDLRFAVPAGSELGDTVARFRISSTGGLAPTGLALDGEVEDHALSTTDWCGALITDDFTLPVDLSCPGDGLVVGASGITIDLGAHTVSGSGGGIGITTASGVDLDEVTVRGGAITGFTNGVVLRGTEVVVRDLVSANNDLRGAVVVASRTIVTGSTFRTNGTDGLLARAGGQVDVADASAIGNGRHGLVLRSGTVNVHDSLSHRNDLRGIIIVAHRSIVAGSVLRANGTDGLLARADGRLDVIDSVARANGRHGVWSLGSGSVVRRSRALGNGGTGIFSNPSEVAVVVGSRASANGIHGILGDADKVRISRNTARSNIRLGVVVPGPDGPHITGSDNTATGNNSGRAQCRPGRLCE